MNSGENKDDEDDDDDDQNLHHCLATHKTTTIKSYLRI